MEPFHLCLPFLSWFTETSKLGEKIDGQHKISAVVDDGHIMMRTEYIWYWQKHHKTYCSTKACFESLTITVNACGIRNGDLHFKCAMCFSSGDYGDYHQQSAMYIPVSGLYYQQDAQVLLLCSFRT